MSSDFILFSIHNRTCALMKLACTSPRKDYENNGTWRPMPLSSTWWEIVIVGILGKSLKARQVLNPSTGLVLGKLGNSNSTYAGLRGIPDNCVTRNGTVYGMVEPYIQDLQHLHDRPSALTSTHSPFNLSERSLTTLAILWISDAITLARTRSLHTGKNIFVTPAGDITPLDFSMLRPRDCSIPALSLYHPYASNPAFARRTKYEGCTDVVAEVAKRVLLIISEVCNSPIDKCTGIRSWDAASLPFFIFDEHIMLEDCLRSSASTTDFSCRSQFIYRYINRPGSQGCIQKYGNDFRSFLQNFLSDAFVSVYSSVNKTYAQCSPKSSGASVFFNLLQLLKNAGGK